MDNSWYFDSLQQGGAAFHFSRGIAVAQKRLKHDIARTERETVETIAASGLMSGRGQKIIARNSEGKQIVIPARLDMTNKKKLEKLGFDSPSIKQILDLTSRKTLEGKPSSLIKFSPGHRNNLLGNIFESNYGRFALGDWQFIVAESLAPVPEFPHPSSPLPTPQGSTQSSPQSSPMRQGGKLYVVAIDPQGEEIIVGKRDLTEQNLSQKFPSSVVNQLSAEIGIIEQLPAENVAQNMFDLAKKTTTIEGHTFTLKKLQ